MKPIRAVVVEDQPLARERLVSLLRAEQVDVVAECEHGGRAVEAIPLVAPDVVFLDVQMPELNAFEVIEAIGVDEMPPVVFVTAFDAYALKAFEVHAIDYLLKPFGQERLAGVVRRLRSTLRVPHEGPAARRLETLLGVPGLAPGRDRLVVRSGGRVVFVPRQDIEWVEASGNYAVIHTAGSTYQVRDRMSALEARLGSTFARIHRSTLVNLHRVQEMQVAGGGEYDVVLRSGLKLRVTRLHRPALEARLLQLE